MFEYDFAESFVVFGEDRRDWYRMIAKTIYDSLARYIEFERILSDGRCCCRHWLIAKHFTAFRFWAGLGCVTIIFERF
jgi:hypothetical protein